MERMKRLTALAMALCLALCLTACDPKEAAADLVYKAVVALGFVEESDDDEEATNDVYAPEGGSITWPDDMETDSARLVMQTAGDTLYVAFNGIANRDTDYFVAGSTSVTITAYATTESPGLHEFKTALWELSDDQAYTNYVKGSTVYFTTGGDCYTQTVTGLTVGQKYKINISYDSSKYYITGGITVQGLADEELTTVENSANG